MEKNELLSSVLMLVLIGVMVGVGVLLLDIFGNQTRESGTVINETVTLSQTRTATLTHTDITKVTFFGNSTINCVNIIPT